MVKEEPVTFRCGGLALEGLIAKPSVGRAAAAVICHPHPRFGGSMHNNVVEAMLEAIRRLGYATLRFNFPGVGLSEGEYEGGAIEVKAAGAALEFLCGTPGVSEQGAVMGGYSFGAAIAMIAGAKIERVGTIVAVAPPLEMVARQGSMSLASKATLVVAGDGDPFCPVAALADFCRKPEVSARFEVLTGADHFFAGCETRLNETIVRAFAPSPARV